MIADVVKSMLKTWVTLRDISLVLLNLIKGFIFVVFKLFPPHIFSLVHQLAASHFDDDELMMMNCFCGIVDRRKAFSFISSRDHCQRSSPLRISDTP